MYMPYVPKETFNEQIINNNDDSKYKVSDTYDYNILNNGSLEIIKEMLQKVIDNNNINSKLIIFNTRLNPILKCDIDFREFNDYGLYLVKMLNETSKYKCFKFANVTPIYKIKADLQIKHQFILSVLYNYPSNNEVIKLKFLVVILYEQLYSESSKFFYEPTVDQLPCDIVKGESSTYIDTFTLLI